MKGNANEAYKQAGVDVDAGNALVERIKPAAKASSRPGVMAGLGGFGAFFDPKAAGYLDPLLVSATDGVGTKLKIATEMGRHDGIGQDLVAMCVNDLVVQGAEPLFFLDYFATGKLDIDQATTIINGIAAACKASGCALIGGETAEMPGMYAEGDYDLAGFAVGAVERGQQITGADIKVGDVVLGLGASGVHSNGFSLVRKIISDKGVNLKDAAPFDTNRSLAEILLEPTKLYVSSLVSSLKQNAPIKGLSHITGGGLLDNIPRILPDGLGVQLDAATWPIPDVMKWMAATAEIDAYNMARTFNCGIGMCVFVNAIDADTIIDILTKEGESVYAIGSVIPSDNAETRVIIDGADEKWKA